MSEKHFHYKWKKGGEITPIDVTEWAIWFEKADRKVAWTKIHYVKISTVFIGLDHNMGNGPPRLFETMVFGGRFDMEVERYPTEKLALRGHKNMCDRIRIHLESGDKP